MKSLEFINKDLQDFEKALENYKKRKTINNEEVDEEYIKQMTKEIENYKQIKQSLEVLELIKKKYVDINFIRWLFNTNSIKQVLKKYNAEGNIRLTLEELIKLKQWLEEQEQ